MVAGGVVIYLEPEQLEAIRNLKSGRVLYGPVGSGKSITALAYYFFKVVEGAVPVNGNDKQYPPKKPKDLYIITTAMKRDRLEWEDELLRFKLGKGSENNPSGINVVIDSWNNISKYIGVKDAFFIFDEQRLVGRGSWVKSFYKIVRSGNAWVILSGTPGDSWGDYVPLFVANGFYKSASEFNRIHAVYNPYTRYPKIERYVDTGALVGYRRDLLVPLPYRPHTKRHPYYITTEHDEVKLERIVKDRWNEEESRPILDAAEMWRLARTLVNSDASRLDILSEVMEKCPKLIIFYNFDYELNLLRNHLDDLRRDLTSTFEKETDTPIQTLAVAEWNGHKHEPIPDSDRWVYLVQYTAGSEGWNCTSTDSMLFFSLNYSYKVMEQAHGRIDRRNTPFKDLNYYFLKGNNLVDNAIWRAILTKKTFNEVEFLAKSKLNGQIQNEQKVATM